jgi:hypothetical protein
MAVQKDSGEPNRFVVSKSDRATQLTTLAKLKTNTASGAELQSALAQLLELSIANERADG